MPKNLAHLIETERRLREEFKKEFVFEHGADEIADYWLKILLQREKDLVGEIEKLDKYDLEDDGACGDPECCGERNYWIGKKENGEYIKFSDLQLALDNLTKRAAEATPVPTPEVV